MSYENACAVDPLDPEAYESLGYFFDAVDEHLDDAEGMFRKAIALGAGPSSWARLARVLAELGRRDEALQLLAPGVCPFAMVETIDEMRFEINEGRWNPKPGAR